MEKITWRKNDSKQNTLYSAVCAVLSFCACLSIVSMLKDNNDLYSFSNSIIALPAFVGCYFSMSRAFRERGRALVISIILGFMLSASQVFGKNLLRTDCTDCQNIKVWLAILGLTPLFTSLLINLFRWIENFRICETSYKLSPSKVFWLSWFILFLAWLPALLASYPGVYAYDCIFEIRFALRDEITIHHPLIHTLMLKWYVVDLGGKVLGNRELGFFFYCITQMLILSGAMANLLRYLVIRKTRKLYCIVVFLIFAFLPVNPLMSIAGTKDIIFSAFGLVCAVCFCELVDKGAAASWKQFTKLAVFLFLTMIFRNQGFYVFLVTMPVAVLILKKRRLMTIVTTVVVTVVYLIYAGPISKDVLHGVSPEYLKHEYFSVPAMTLVRAYQDENRDLTPEEIEFIQTFCATCDKDATGGWGIADPYKNYCNAGVFLDHPVEATKMWLNIGRKHTVDYIDAWGRLTIGLWYSDMNYRDPEAFHPYWEYVMSTGDSEEYIYLERTTPSSLQWLSDWYDTLTYQNSYQKVPVLSALFSTGVYFWLMMIFIGWCICYRRYRYLLVAVFPFVYWLTMLLGPVVLYRYVYIVGLDAVLMIGIMINSYEGAADAPAIAAESAGGSK